MKRPRLVLAAAAPAAIWIVLVGLWLIAATVGGQPGGGTEEMTLSEAAAVASYADVARLLAAGVDPNGRYRVRANLVRNDERMLTPLEAATGAIRTGPLQTLFDHGARIDETTYPVLWCAANARHNDDMITFLQVHLLTNVYAVDCGNVRRVW